MKCVNLFIDRVKIKSIIKPKNSEMEKNKMLDMRIDEAPRFTEYVGFKIRPEMKEEVKKIAENLGVASSQVMRRFISIGLEMLNEKNKKAEKKK